MTLFPRFSALLAFSMFLLSTAACSRDVAAPRQTTPRGPLAQEEKLIVDLFESAAPSVAYIFTERIERRGFFMDEVVAQGQGSGFVWDASGHVVTNYHVIEGARRVLVQLDVGKQIPAKIVGVAPDYDLAVLRLDEPPRGLRALPLGASRDLKIGQSVFAIGNPFGLSRTLTRGIVSALDRELPTANFREIAGAIQTDAAINPGNSGGPLLDSAGRLIGVNTAIRSASGSSAGVGFAIPVDLVNRIVPSLINTGRAPQPGIGIQPANPVLVARAGITGVVIAEVRAGTPAARAGLRALNQRTGALGDVIIAVNGKPVDTLSTFVRELDRAGIGATVELTLSNEGRERKASLQVIDVR